MRAVTRYTPVALIGAFALAVLIIGCAVEQSAGPSAETPQFQIWDGAHLGNADFFFLPPMVPDPSGDDEFDAGWFDGGRLPTVEICALAGDDCATPEPGGFPIQYSMSTGPGSETVRLVEADEHFIVNWHTDEFALDDLTTYRIRVLVEGMELGFADVDVVNSGKELKNVTTNEYIALKDGRTLPVKFRIEYGAPYRVGPAGGTVSALDGTVALDVPADALTDDTDITVRPATTYPENPNLVPGTVFDFGPDGTLFTPSALLTIGYNPSLIPSGGEESSLVLGHVVGGVWTDVSGSTVNTVDHTVTGPVQGFSLYGVLVSQQISLSASLAYHSDTDGDYEIFTTDGTDLTQRTSNADRDEAPDWIGDRIVYQSLQAGDYDLWLMDDGGDPLNLTNNPNAWEMGPKWSPDGSRIAYVQWIPGEDYDIWVMNADGSGNEALAENTVNDGALAWSPDGTRIAFQRGQGLDMEVYVMNSDGSGEPTQLTSDPDYSDGSPDWSPDGTQIVFAKYVTGVEGDIWVMNSDGTGVPQNITNSATLEISPAWSPDGTQIAFQRYPDPTSSVSDIWVIGPDGTGAAPVAADPAANEGGAAWFRQSPDNVAPTVDAGPDLELDEGSLFRRTVTFTDPNADEWHAQIDYGDGSPVELLPVVHPNAPFETNHRYADDGDYTMVVHVWDDAGGEGSDQTTVTVQNVAPAVIAGPNLEVRKGITVDFVGEIRDPGDADTHTIEWDFGDESPPVTGTLTPQHTYDAVGMHTVTLTVTDDDGGVGTAEKMVYVSENQAPIASISILQEQQFLVVLSGAGSSDPEDDPITYAWDFGDGTTGDGVTVSHTYPGPGTYTVTLTVTDSFGASGTATANVINSDQLESVEVRVTNSDDYFETTPRLGADAQGTVLVYASVSYVPGGEIGYGEIMAQRLDTDGMTNGQVIQVSDGSTDDKLNDVSGSVIVYSAFFEKYSQTGQVKVFDLNTRQTEVITEDAATIFEARIHGSAVVWTQGDPLGLKVMYYDLTWQTGLPVTIAGPTPDASNVEIGERYIVWEEQSGAQSDIGAYDYILGSPIPVSTDPDRDERNPSTSGSYVVWESTALDGSMTIEVADLSLDAGNPLARVSAVSNGADVLGSSIDGDLVAYESDLYGNFDIFLYRISDGRTFQLTSQPDNQYLSDVFGNMVAYADERNATRDVYVSTFRFVSGN